MAVNFALIKFSGLQLLLPQTEVGLIEVSGNIVAEESAPNAIGMLKSGSNAWPVFVLGADLQPNQDRPENNKFCLCMNLGDDAVFSITCEEVSTLSFEHSDDLKLVPACMRIPNCPIEFLVLKDNQMMLVSNSELMQQYLVPETTEE